nr:substrate-binding domain-containing protein [Caldilineaceae bacterium]
MNSNSMSRRSFLRLSGMAVAGSALAACSTSAPPAGGSASTGAAESSSAPAAAAKSFVLWGLEYDPHIERYHMLADAFLKKTDVQAVIEPQAWPIEVKVIAAMAAGTVPDVTCIMGKQLVPLLQQKAIIPMEDEVFAPTGIKLEEFFNPGAIGAYFYDGKYWGIPVEDNNVGFMVGVRTDWVEEAGADAQALWPVAQDENAYALESFEQMWNLAELLQKTDESGNVTVWGMSGQGWDNRTWYGIMRDLGQNW